MNDLEVEIRTVRKELLSAMRRQNKLEEKVQRLRDRLLDLELRKRREA